MPRGRKAVVKMGSQLKRKIDRSYTSGSINKHRSGSNADANKSVVLCTICLEELTGNRAKPSCCDHMFCEQCLTKWVERSNSCPVDRKTFTKMILTKQDGKKKVVSVESREADDVSVDLHSPSSIFCHVCGSADNEDVLLVCEICSAGIHCYCLDPPLESVPTDDWICPDCCTDRGDTLSDSVLFDPNIEIIYSSAGHRRPHTRSTTRNNQDQHVSEYSVDVNPCRVLDSTMSSLGSSEETLELSSDEDDTTEDEDSVSSDEAESEPRPQQRRRGRIHRRMTSSRSNVAPTLENPEIYTDEGSDDERGRMQRLQPSRRVQRRRNARNMTVITRSPRPRRQDPTRTARTVARQRGPRARRNCTASDQTTNRNTRSNRRLDENLVTPGMVVSDNVYTDEASDEGDDDDSDNSERVVDKRRVVRNATTTSNRRRRQQR